MCLQGYAQVVVLHFVKVVVSVKWLFHLNEVRNRVLRGFEVKVQSLLSFGTRNHAYMLHFSVPSSLRNGPRYPLCRSLYDPRVVLKR
jgi:hypothetical protein